MIYLQHIYSIHTSTYSTHANSISSWEKISRKKKGQGGGEGREHETAAINAISHRVDDVIYPQLEQHISAAVINTARDDADDKSALGVDKRCPSGNGHQPREDSVVHPSDVEPFLQDSQPNHHYQDSGRRANCCRHLLFVHVHKQNNAPPHTYTYGRQEE